MSRRNIRGARSLHVNLGDAPVAVPDTGGDILLAVDGIPTGNLADYNRMREHLQRLAPGVPITVTVLRAGRVLHLVGKAP